MLLGLLLALLGADDAGASAAAIYAKAAPAVVGITCRLGPQSFYFGTGAIIDPKGLIVTSITVVPKDAQRIRVYMTGGVVRSARCALTNAEKELSLLWLESPPDSPPYPYLPLGDSNDLRVGEVAVTLGNAFQSIENDDQVAIGEGVVSGLYDLNEPQDQSQYRGRVIETTAHLNDGMDGGPLVSSSGHLIGILCLNYSRHRWLGTAVPINELKPLIAGEKAWLSDSLQDYPVYAGVEAEESAAGGALVLRVERQGPAALAGLAARDRVLKANGQAIQTLQDLKNILARLKPGDELDVEYERQGSQLTARIRLWGKNWRWV